jgi:hypothetical protein
MVVDGRSAAQSVLGVFLMKQALLQRIHDAQIQDWCGKVLYSGVSTLRKGAIYFLGVNPGGDPTKEPATLAEHIAQTPQDWNEYLDAVWMPKGVRTPAGQALLQRRVRWLLEQLGLQPREVCASNLIFGRSLRQEHLGGKSEQLVLANRCWPIHKWIMEQVQPKAILCMGNFPFDYIREKELLNRITHYASGHGNWTCRATKWNGSQLISVPHLSLYSMDSHPEVATWIGEMISNGQ